MSEARQLQAIDSNAAKIEKVVICNDLSVLNDAERVNYYKSVCDSLGLNWLTQPFSYIELNNKLTLYANKGCTDQLRAKNKVSIKITSRDKIGDVYVVTAQAKDATGREDESTGAVALASTLKGDQLANAYMKAETKAKRRVTLSLCGLGFLDETEVDSIADAKRVDVNFETGEIKNVTPPKEEQKSQDPAEYVVPFGKKYKGVALKNIHPEEIESFCNWLENDSKSKGKSITGPAAEFMDMAAKYLQQIKWTTPKGDAFECEDIQY